MKKFIAFLLSLCMLIACTCSPAAATENVSDNGGLYQTSDEQYKDVELDSDDEMLFTFDIVPDGNGNSTIQPRNKDYLRMSQVECSGTFLNDKAGNNLKIHIYVESATTKIWVYFVKGNRTPTERDTCIATWSGTGHKYADLQLNAETGWYGVYLAGGFTGHGAVYSEP